MWSKDIVNSVFIKGVQDSDNDETLSHVEFKMEQDKILRIIKSTTIDTTYCHMKIKSLKSNLS